MLNKIYDWAVLPLILVNLFLSAIYLVYKVPDVIKNGFEHNGFIYVNADTTNTDMVEQEYADPQKLSEGEV